MDSAKPMGAQTMVKLNGTQKKTKSQECGEVTGLLKGDERGWCESNQSALYTCIQLSKNKFNKSFL